MFRSPCQRAAGLLLAATVLFAIVEPVSAQADGGAGAPGGAGGGASGQREDVAAAGDFVFVLQGDTIHKFDAEGLKKVKAVRLAR